MKEYSLELPLSDDVARKTRDYPAYEPEIPVKITPPARTLL
jgi:hypothetical protein